MLRHAPKFVFIAVRDKIKIPPERDAIFVHGILRRSGLRNGWHGNKRIFAALNQREGACRGEMVVRVAGFRAQHPLGVMEGVPAMRAAPDAVIQREGVIAVRAGGHITDGAVINVDVVGVGVVARHFVAAGEEVRAAQRAADAEDGGGAGGADGEGSVKVAGDVEGGVVQGQAVDAGVAADGEMQAVAGVERAVQGEVAVNDDMGGQCAAALAAEPVAVEDAVVAERAVKGEGVAVSADLRDVCGQGRALGETAQGLADMLVDARRFL